MEKVGVIRDDVTPDTEDRLMGVKTAGADDGAAVREAALDDDLTHRLAARASAASKRSCGS